MSKRNGPIRQKRGDSILQRGKIDGIFFYVCHNSIGAEISQKIFQFFYKYLYIINYTYMNKVILLLYKMDMKQN